MADTDLDLCPREQRIRIAAGVLEEAERAFREAAMGALLELHDPADLSGLPRPYQRGFYPSYLRDKAGAHRLADRAARAALFVILADDGVDLPQGVQFAFDMPEPA